MGWSGGKVSPRDLMDVGEDEVDRWKCGILEACFGLVIASTNEGVHKGAWVPAVAEVNDRSSHFKNEILSQEFEKYPKVKRKAQ